MSTLFPSWVIPLWILGVPLVLAIVERLRTPAGDSSYLNRSPRLQAAR